MSVIVVATFFPKPDQRAAVRDAIASAIPQVHQEPGVLRYALHERADRFVLIEKWQDQAALDVHGQQAPLANLVAAVQPLINGEIDIVVLDPVPMGDATLGAL